jgi:hypothetical protein
MSELEERYDDLRDWIESQADHCFADEIDTQVGNLDEIARAAGLTPHPSS